MRCCSLALSAAQIYFSYGYLAGVAEQVAIGYIGVKNGRQNGSRLKHPTTAWHKCLRPEALLPGYSMFTAQDYPVTVTVSVMVVGWMGQVT